MLCSGASALSFVKINYQKRRYAGVHLRAIYAARPAACRLRAFYVFCSLAHSKRRKLDACGKLAALTGIQAGKKLALCTRQRKQRTQQRTKKTATIIRKRRSGSGGRGLLGCAVRPRCSARCGGTILSQEACNPSSWQEPFRPCPEGPILPSRRRSRSRGGQQGRRHE